MDQDKLSLLNDSMKQTDLSLVMTDTGLVIQHTDFTPIAIDFLNGKLHHRSSQHIFGELVVKACGAKSKPYILDLTAGLGRDAYLLASTGCQVCMLERNPIMHALLNDALFRLKQTTDISLSLIQQNSCYLTNEILWKLGSPEVIYIDPMHPERTKSALVKKEMRILRELVGQDIDRIELIESALNLNVKKVVVKWPTKQLLNVSKKPSHTFKGKSIRFDVFQVN